MKVYLAAAFRSLSNRENKSLAYGEVVDNDYINFLESIEGVFLQYGFSTCLPHRDEGLWGKVYYDPAPLSNLCLRHVETSDIVFTIAEEGRGVHIELGYATAFKDKLLILFYRKDKEPSTLIWGLKNNFSPWENTNSDESIIKEYADTNDLILNLDNILSKLGYKKINNSNHKLRKGIIDIGSHTLKFSIIEYIKGTYSNVIYKNKASLGIIDDILKNNEFSEATIESVVDTIENWLTVSKGYNCEDFTIVGTEALRKAKNADDLTTKISNKFNLSLKTIDQDEELNLMFNAINEAFNMDTSFSVLNLGGGSIQVGTSKNGKLNKYLIPFGTNNITQKWPWNKKLNKEEFNTIYQYTKDILKNSLGESNEIEELVYTGGELEFMLKCKLHLKTYFKSSSHVSYIDVESYKDFCYKFATFTPEEISEKFSLDINWAKGSVAANAIGLATAEILNVKRIIPSNFNISNGLLLM